jgi:hypothetical protein
MGITRGCALAGPSDAAAKAAIAAINLNANMEVTFPRGVIRLFRYESRLLGYAKAPIIFT